MSFISERFIPLSVKVALKGTAFDQEIDVLHVGSGDELPKVKQLVSDGVLDKPLDIANDFDGSHRVSWKTREDTETNALVMESYGLKRRDNRRL